MSIMPLNDSMWLLAEGREHPIHVGGLELFRLPPDAGPGYVGDVHRELINTGEVARMFRRTPRAPVNSLGQFAWVEDGDLDLEYHVRLSALPKPGRVRELLELVSRLHGTLLDRHRPLWEMHLIEGLEDDRFAVYTKVHHSLLDGVSALRLLQRSLTSDPQADTATAPFQARPRPAGEPERTTASTLTELPQRLSSQANEVVRAVGDLARFGPTLAGKIRRGLREPAEMLPYQAPRSILNVPITGARRFAAQDWPLHRLNAVRKATGTTINDVVLAMCSGALRHYLLDLDALPESPLVAAVPVSIRRDDSAQGNAIGGTLCELATDATDPATRLERIAASMASGKEAFSGRSPLEVLLLSAFAVGGLALQPIPGVPELTRPPFNLIISNVPGPRRPLYYNGAELEGLYPVSIPYDGQALNITCVSYADRLSFGLTGCRRSVPHLQRLLGHLETALVELEKATAAA
ncbi:WS/DGAT/MGAT family O-acyltransferase [Sciscionella sediminilitoris]|uniref:WS/DGAT/MGAT family O-acyltransferase n=1 Tax=Sciscionella sediminilitoris TaxID=1445613 RepID=UPI0004DF3A3F|nr:wax ester/triacylglycerol synthase family O-acyltransferase [Sciscionella sp. SE31]